MNEAETILCTLTRRERQVLQCLADGLTAKEMGRDLSLAPRTIDWHRMNLIAKLQAKNTMHAAVIAMRMGLIK